MPRKKTRPAPDASAAPLADDETASSHPLFTTALPIASIRVTRIEPTGTHFVPRSFAPEELQDLTQLYDLFGGGLYELIANGRQVDKNGVERFCIVDRKKWPVAGKSKPLVQEPVAEPAAPTPAPAHGGDLVQVLLQQNQNLMTMYLAQQKSSTDMLIAVIGNRGGNDAATEALSELAKSALNRPAPEPSAQLSADKMFDLAHRLGKAEGELEAGGGEDGDDDMGVLGTVLESFMQARGGNKPGPPSGLN